MTPRLRNLLIGLGISVAIMIFDQFSKSSGSSSSKPTRKAKIQRPKKDTAPITTMASSTPKPKKQIQCLVLEEEHPYLLS